MTTTENVFKAPESYQEVIDRTASKRLSDLQAAEAPPTQEKAQDAPQDVETQANVTQGERGVSASRRLLDAQKRHLEERRRREAQPKEEETERSSFDRFELRLMAKQDPERFLKEIGGIDPQYLGEYIINGNKVTDPQAHADIIMQQVDDKIKELRVEHERFAEEQRASQRERGVQEFKDYASRFFESDECKDRYKHFMMTSKDPVKNVYDLIMADFEEQLEAGVESPTLKTIEEAAQEFENDLVDLKARLLGEPTNDKIVNDGDDAGQRAPEKQGSAEAEQSQVEEDPREAYARRMLEAMMGDDSSGGDADVDSDVVITNDHTQQLNDRTSETIEEDMFRAALDDVSKGLV